MAERSAYIISVTRMGEPGPPDGEGNTFLRNVGADKRHTV
jgi:hypothetical protein